MFDHYADTLEYFFSSMNRDHLESIRTKRKHHPAFLKHGTRIIKKPEPKWPKPLEFALDMDDAIVESWEEKGVHFSFDVGHPH